MRNGNYYLLALGTTWNANNTVQQTAEGFGPPGGYYGLTFLYQNYNYDRLNRLQAVVDTNYSRGFNYDEFGNMSLSEYGTVMPSTLAPLSGGGRANPYDPGTNRLLGTTFGYDTRGDLTTLGAMTITYDAEASQTRTVDSGTGQTISYTFDAEGQRVEKQISGGATIIDVHDAFGNLAAEYNSAGVTPACTTCYLVYDGVGSVRLVTDQSGNIVARHDYLPFGDEIANGVAGRIGNFGFTTNITQGFTGQEYDGGTGWLDYFNARHLSVAIGSFTQPDPMQAGADFLNPQSWNAYGYVLGNPLGMVDPSGMTQQNAGGLDGYNCYSAEYAYPCYGIPIGGWGGWGGGGGAPSGGGGGFSPSGGGSGSPGEGSGGIGQLPPGAFPGSATGSNGFLGPADGLGVAAAELCVANPVCVAAAGALGLGYVLFRLAPPLVSTVPNYWQYPGPRVLIQPPVIALKNWRAKPKAFPKTEPKFQGPEALGPNSPNYCAKQWSDAFETCSNPKVRKGKSLLQCAAGFVDRECKGNDIYWGK